jgi:preprotein translocase subunit SecE
MNREQKRLLQRQGQLGPDGEPVARKRDGAARPPTAAPTGRPARTKPREFLHEVTVEMRKVAWPSRAEVTNYSIVVLATLVVVIAMIFVLDYIFAKGAIFLFK